MKLPLYIQLPSPNPEVSTSRSALGDQAAPLILLMPAGSIAAIHGGYAERLQLPTAWVAQHSHLIMLALVVVSFCMGAFRWRSAVYFSGIAFIAYPFLLLAIGSSPLELSRVLSVKEENSFRQRFPVPMVQSGSTDRTQLQLRRQDLTPEVRAYLRSIDALPTSYSSQR